MIDLAALTVLDYAVFFAVAVSCIISLMRGFMRELLGIIGWVVSFVVANYAAPRIAAPINDTLSLGGFGEALSWGLPFALTVVFWFILASMIAPSLARGLLGSFDRWLGIAFGFLRGGLVVLILFIASILSVDGEDNLPDYIKSAQTTPILSKSAYQLAQFLPVQYGDQITDNLSYSPPIIAGSVADQINSTIEVGKEAANNGMKLLKDETANQTNR